MPRRPTHPRSLAIAAVAGLALGAACTPAPPPPAGELPTNPGRFTGTIEPGSFLQTVDEGGRPYPASHIDLGRPACADGKDNDVDATTDVDDPGCVGADDANERLAGHQAFEPTTVAINVRANGVISVRPSDIVVQQREYCLPVGDDVLCSGITVRGAGPPVRGSISGTTMTIPYPITIDIEWLSGDWTVEEGCAIGYIDSVFTGDDYDEATGRVTLRTADVPVPAATGCGPFENAINGSLGVPTLGESTVVSTFVDADGVPIQLG